MKRHKTMKYISLFPLLVILFACSCSAPKELVYQNVQNFRLKQNGLQTQMCLDINMFNPNRYGMKLKDADVDVFLNGRSLGKMQVDESCTIPRLDTFALPVMLNVDLKNVLPNALQLLISSDVEIKLSGSIKAGKHGIYKKVPVSYQGRQDIKGSIKW